MRLRMWRNGRLRKDKVSGVGSRTNLLRLQILSKKNNEVRPFGLQVNEYGPPVHTNKSYLINPTAITNKDVTCKN